MKISTTDTLITLESEDEIFTLLEKPKYPEYSNVTARPHFMSYYTEEETIWDRFHLCMERLPAFCPDDPYLGCYALLFRRLYTLLLSGSQAKNIIAYGPSTDCGAYRIFQDFMTFLQENSALTALAQSPFSFAALTKGSCHALLYRLDTCPGLAAVCDAMEKVKPGGLILLYTRQGNLPEELAPLYERAEVDSFDSCTVYALTMDETLSAFVRANSSEPFLLSCIEEVLQHAGNLKNLITAILGEGSCSKDTYMIAAILLHKTEEVLLALYDYLENDELPIHVNALKEALHNYYTGICGGPHLTTYREKLKQLSSLFFTSIEKEFEF